MKMIKDIKFVRITYPWRDNNGESSIATAFATSCPHFPNMNVGDWECRKCPFFVMADFTNNIVKCRYTKIELMKKEKNKPDYVLIGIILGTIAFWGGLAGLLCIFF